eukprot:TRINITY_DN23458_c0_g1_i1.p1 TRINITY_DN23458_c0_g1~~TRINITY_DN23458_c0_g1_i1.p1  ORF type:complete len:206 (+),score=37.08 TRINITY_DN23458_c0_g1_i1:72-689(+)
MSILQYNGGAVVVMTGKKCVAIASDLRFGVQQQTLTTDFPKVYELSPKCFVGLTGLVSDTQTLWNTLKFRVNMYKLRENREMKPSVCANLLSTMLYEKRFGPWFVEPVVCGLEGPDDEPFISAMDLIGAPLLAKDCVLAGTCTESLYGMCESLYKPDMSPDELFETVSQALLASNNRDAFSGWGAIVHIITPEKVITKELKSRQD